MVRTLPFRGRDIGSNPVKSKKRLIKKIEVEIRYKYKYEIKVK